MKLLVLFFVLSVRLCYAIDGYAQSTYFTLELNNKTVKEVFKAIEKNSEYVVFYLKSATIIQYTIKGRFMSR